MHLVDINTGRRGLRAIALLAISALGLIGIVGSGGGGGSLSDCPPGLDCSGAATPVPVVRPEKVTAQVGTPVTFVGTAPNVPAAQVTYQWYRSADGGAHYTAIAGASGDTLTLPSVNLADDGVIFQVTATANGLSGSATGRLAVSASPGVVFADGEFQPADWLAVPLPDGSTPAPTHVDERVTTGGNPGAYRKMAFQLAPAAESGVVAYTGLAARYEPQTQGAIYVIDYSEDGIWLETNATIKAARSALLLEQGGRRYIAAPPGFNLSVPIGWVSSSTLSLRASDFTLRDGAPCQAGEVCPDFSALGAPIRFGYWRIASGRPGASVSHGIDNWRVTVWRR